MRFFNAKSTKKSKTCHKSSCRFMRILDLLSKSSYLHAIVSSLQKPDFEFRSSRTLFSSGGTRDMSKLHIWLDLQSDVSRCCGAEVIFQWKIWKHGFRTLLAATKCFGRAMAFLWWLISLGLTFVDFALKKLSQRNMTFLFMSKMYALWGEATTPLNNSAWTVPTVNRCASFFL